MAEAILAWLAGMNGHAQTVINEVLFNPPGTDIPHQYVEIRGQPNAILSQGTYFVAVEGDLGGNPGTVQNVFDLSGRRLGGNGLLVLLQKTNLYNPAPGAMILTQTGGDNGFGHGGGSTVGHRGEDGRTDIEGPSVTFFLIQTTNKPSVGEDLDADNDGTPDAPWFASWTILDSVGLLDNSGAGDVAYGAINFRRNAGAQAGGVIVSVSFTPSYVARTGNTTGSAANAWLAGDGLGGSAPNWTLGDHSQTVPAEYAGLGLDHLGRPNFGAPDLPGILLIPNQGELGLAEGGAFAVYSIALNTAPAGLVTLQLDTTTGQVEFSLDNGLTYTNQALLVLDSTSPVAIRVRAVDDNQVEASPQAAEILHTVAASLDPVNYPVGTPIPPMRAAITDNDTLLLNELKVNPPGTDQPFEFIEVRGQAGALLRGVFLLVLESDLADDPGLVRRVISMEGATLGGNGLLLVAATNHPYTSASGATVLLAPALSVEGGALMNKSASFLLVALPSPVAEGADLDQGNNGALEGLPDGSRIMDAVTFVEAGRQVIAYGGAPLALASGLPDAAARFPNQTAANTANAWFYGQLLGPGGESAEFDLSRVGAIFPYGALMTPGAPNQTALTFSLIKPVCGTIGDPTNPKVYFTLTDTETNLALLSLGARSFNQLVVADSQLVLTPVAQGQWVLTISPQGVGYSSITLSATNAGKTAQISFPYAASDMGRPGGLFHSGAADASTAIPLDESWMLVGDDENQVLRLYSRTNSGPPVWQTNMTELLGLTDIENGTPREVDIEASTRVGNTIFWVGAHSHANIAELRTNRSRIFATALSGAGTNLILTYLGRYDYLKLDLVNWDVGNGHGKGANYYGLFASTADGVDPKSPEGFNIEGLAMAPGSQTTAYLALRAPIVPPSNRTHALIVPVLNFPALAASTGPPGSAQFGPPIEMDLFGRGFRSLEGDANGYLIIAGTPLNIPGPYPNDFKLFTWTGQPNDAPVQRDTDLSGLNPEAIVALPPLPWTPASVIQLISDNGIKDWYGDGTPAKFLPVREFRKFRSDVVSLGNATAPAPWLQSVVVNNASASVTWRGVQGFTYRLQYRDQLPGFGWTNVPGDVTATGPYSAKTDPSVPAVRRFYRVVIP